MSAIKLKLGYNEYLNNKIIMTDYRRSIDAESIEKNRMAVAYQSASLAFYINEAVKKTITPAWNQTGMAELFGVGDKFEAGDCVIGFDKGYIETLTDDEFMAILSHERAHVLFGDCYELSKMGQTGMIIINEIEHRADQYGAMLYGKDNMRNALIKAVRYQASIAYEVPTYEQDMMGSEDFQIRLNALC